MEMDTENVLITGGTFLSKKSAVIYSSKITANCMVV